MTTRFLPFQRTVLPVLIVALLLLSLFAMGRTLMKTGSAVGGVDLHPYWYYGHFVRAGMNPYTAYAEGLTLPGPVQYIDGSVVAPDMVAQRHLAIIPANTAPLLLALSPLAFFPWHLVKILWLVCNFALALAIPWLVLRLLPPALQLTPALNWLAAFSFYAMKGTRVALVNGQPSLLVFFLMIVTLLLRQTHWLWAGVALGVALGKYSLALPVVIFLLFEKRFRLLAVAGMVQVLGLAIVARFEGGAFWETIQVYWAMLARHSGQPGMHLAYVLRESPQVATLLLVAGSLVTVAMIVFSQRSGWLAADLLPVNSMLLLWMLLATYHRVYDAMLAIFFLILCLSAATTWQLPARQTYLLGAGWLVLVAILCLPGEIVPPFLTNAQADVYILWVERSMTLAIIVMWAMNLWLVPRTPRIA